MSDVSLPVLVAVAGVDGSVCLLNYREDGTTFWNQFFIAALRGADGNIVNYVGVQCKVGHSPSLGRVHHP